MTDWKICDKDDDAIPPHIDSVGLPDQRHHRFPVGLMHAVVEADLPTPLFIVVGGDRTLTGRYRNSHKGKVHAH
jgi:hypothetical protein